MVAAVVASAGWADPVTLKYAPAKGAKHTYQVTMQGTVDVSEYAAGVGAEGRAVYTEEVAESDADKVISTMVIGKGHLSAAGAYLPSTSADEALVRTRDATRRVVAVEGTAVAYAGEDPVVLCLWALDGFLLPKDPVEPGTTWDCSHTAIGPDGTPRKVAGEASLVEVKDVDGVAVAVVRSTLTTPVSYAYGDPMTGDIRAEVTTELALESGDIRSQDGVMSGTIATGPDAFQKLSVTFNDVQVIVRLVEPKAEGQPVTAPQPN